MNRFSHIAILLLACAVALFPARSFAQDPAGSTTPGIVSVPLANVHDRPGPRSVLITQVLMGDEVHILEKQDYRYRIAIDGQDNREGWIQQEAVSVPKDRGRSYLSPDRLWVVIAVPKADVLILDPTGDHKVSLYAGTRLPVLEHEGVSYKVQFPDRSLAIIAAKDVLPVRLPDPLTNETSPDDLTRTAKKFLGVRHLAGGLTAQGLDSRGLVYIVYRIHGFTLSTERALLKTRAGRVTKKELQAGDILVFNGESEGLYVGNGRFLHSPKKTAVQLGSIFEKRYASAFQYGLRIIGAEPDAGKTPAEMTADEVFLLQVRTSPLPLGKRISFWAGRFIGTPYDADPLGLYVRSNRVVADEKVDCMYHAFRSVELAQSGSPAEAVEKALTLRFRTEGRLADGLVVNYDQRYEYGEDMVYSGKWGKNITEELGTTRTIPGSRGKENVRILPKYILATATLQRKLQDGDIVFWVKDPRKRVVEEIVAHLSIVRVRAGKPYVIHAAGNKDSKGVPGGGVVKEVSFSEYVQNMRFIGAYITRFE